MPVKKYRSVEDMPGVAPRRPGDPGNLEIAFELSELAYALHPWRFEPGVRKYRSAEAMYRAQHEREIERLRRDRAEVLVRRGRG